MLSRCTQEDWVSCDVRGAAGRPLAATIPAPQILAAWLPRVGPWRQRFQRRRYQRRSAARAGLPHVHIPRGSRGSGYHGTFHQ